MVAKNEKSEYTQEEILSCLYDKSYRCPCCDVLFTERAVKDDSVSLCGHSSVIRNYYKPVDPLLYEIVYCTSCGYASLSRTFESLSFKSAQIVSSLITPRFNINSFPQVYSHEIGALRYKAAITTALAIRERSVLIGYLYMKLAWIYRDTNNNEAEKKMMAAAVEGFLESVQKDCFPFAELTKVNTLAIMADFLYRMDEKKDAKLLISKIAARGDITKEISAWLNSHPIN